MLNKKSLLLAAAAVALSAGSALAEPSDRNDNRNGATPYSNSDHSRPDYGNGYNYGYDDGAAHRDRNDRYRADAWRSHDDTRGHDGYQRGAYYYGSDCSGNAATGTIIGAIVGGAIGNHIGHGSGAATFGGVILGGLAGNALSRHTDCNDRRYALTSYSAGFEGRIGERHDWRNDQGGNYGSFTPTREYSRNGTTCRDYSEMTYQNGRRFNDTGTACRQDDGNWHVE